MGNSSDKHGKAKKLKGQWLVIVDFGEDTEVGEDGQAASGRLIPRVDIYTLTKRFERVKSFNLVEEPGLKKPFSKGNLSKHPGTMEFFFTGETATDTKETKTTVQRFKLGEGDTITHNVLAEMDITAPLHWSCMNVNGSNENIYVFLPDGKTYKLDLNAGEHILDDIVDLDCQIPENVNDVYGFPGGVVFETADEELVVYEAPCAAFPGWKKRKTYNAPKGLCAVVKGCLYTLSHEGAGNGMSLLRIDLATGESSTATSLDKEIEKSIVITGDHERVYCTGYHYSPSTISVIAVDVATSVCVVEGYLDKQTSKNHIAFVFHLE